MNKEELKRKLRGWIKVVLSVIQGKSRIENINTALGQ